MSWLISQLTLIVWGSSHYLPPVDMPGWDGHPVTEFKVGLPRGCYWWNVPDTRKLKLWLAKSLSNVFSQNDFYTFITSHILFVVGVGVHSFWPHLDHSVCRDYFFPSASYWWSLWWCATTGPVPRPLVSSATQPLWGRQHDAEQWRFIAVSFCYDAWSQVGLLYCDGQHSFVASWIVIIHSSC